MWLTGERILLTLWVGSLWAIGYIVAPVLFNELDRSTAGNVAGQLFTLVSYLGMFVVAVILFVAFTQNGLAVMQQWRNRILLLAFVLIMVGQFVLHPMMAELKAAGLEGANAKQFATLHGVSSILYMINSLLGLALVVWSVRSKIQTGD